MNDDDPMFSPHRKETCPMKEIILANSNAVTQILAKLDKIETRLDTHAVNVEAKLSEIIKSCDSKYVSKDTFAPIQKLIYGAVGAIVLAFLGAVWTLVIQHS